MKLEKKSRQQGGTILIELLKVFDTLNDNLLVNTPLSSWNELIKGLRQGSVLGLLLFTMYLK